MQIVPTARANPAFALFVATLVLMCVPSAAHGQSPAQVVQDALAGNTSTSSGVGALGGGRFGGNPAVVIAIFKQQTATLPLGTSSGGFTWIFDRSLGVVVRKSDSFGPMFADRPLTIGAGKLSVGLTTQHTSWRSLAGRVLAEGDLYSSDLFIDDFYTDTLEPVLEHFGSVLDLQTDRTTVNLTYGVTDRLDLNAIVPFGRTTVSGGADYLYTLVASGDVRRRIFSSVSAVAAGIADVAVKAKYQVVTGPVFTGSVAVELRFPTGDEEKLLGTGALQTRISTVGAITMGSYTARVEGGYLFGGDGLSFLSRPGAPVEFESGEPSDEIAYSAGLDVTVGRRMTITGDVLGRTLLDSARIVPVTLRTVLTSVAFTRELTYFRAEPANLSLLVAAIGGKVAIGSSWLVTASALFPLNDAGLTPGVTPVVGFERSF